MKTPYRESQDIYSIAFYARFNGAANPGMAIWVVKFFKGWTQNGIIVYCQKMYYAELSKIWQKLDFQSKLFMSKMI